MRISDWSSDVCSSELLLQYRALQHRRARPAAVDRILQDKLVHLVARGIAAGHRRMDVRADRDLGRRFRNADQRDPAPRQLVEPGPHPHFGAPEVEEADRKSVVWGKGGAVRVNTG